jgi:hypothetical protein
VPSSFLGVSTEYWAVPMFERHMALFERVLSLLPVPASTPDQLERARLRPKGICRPHCDGRTSARGRASLSSSRRNGSVPFRLPARSRTWRHGAAANASAASLINTHAAERDR